jgi:hypothetical protein
MSKKLYCVKCGSDQIAMTKITSVPYQLYINSDDLLYLDFPKEIDNKNITTNNYTKYDILCLDCGAVIWSVPDPSEIEKNLRSGGIIRDKDSSCSE